MNKCCIFKDQTQGFSGSNGSISFIKIKNIIKDLLSILKLPITNPKYKSLFVFARLPKMWASSCTRVLTVLLLTGTIWIACFFIQQTTWRMTPNVDPLESWNHFLLNHLVLNVLMISGRGEFLKTEALERQKDKQETKTACWIMKLQSNNPLDQPSTVYLILKALCFEIYQNWNCGMCHQIEWNIKITAKNFKRRYYL